MCWKFFYQLMEIHEGVKQIKIFILSLHLACAFLLHLQICGFGLLVWFFWLLTIPTASEAIKCSLTCCASLIKMYLRSLQLLDLMHRSSYNCVEDFVYKSYASTLQMKTKLKKPRHAAVMDESRY